MYESPDFYSKKYYFGRKNSNYISYKWLDNDFFWKSIITAIKKYGANGKMLDVGCALGYLLKRTSPYFEKAYGFDISQYAIKEARKNAPSAELTILDINKDQLPYPDNYFDFITALDILEHTQSIEESLGKILAKLKTGGYLIIAVPLKDTWGGKLLALFDKDKSHINIPTEDELFSLVDKLGLKILEKNYFFNTGIIKIKNIPVDIELVLQKINH